MPLIGVKSDRTRVTDRVPLLDEYRPAKDASVVVGAALAGTFVAGAAGMVRSVGWQAFLTTLAEDVGLAFLVAV